MSCLAKRSEATKAGDKDMDFEEMRRRVKNPDFIPGIDLYCDRWCERCSFTSRCENFALQEEVFPDAESQDIGTPQFMERVIGFLHSTFDTIRKQAEEQGLDVLSQEATEDDEGGDECDWLATESPAAEGTAPAGAPDAPACALLAAEYAEMAEKWLDSANALFQEKTRELETINRLDLPERNPTEEAASLSDAVSVVRWFQHMIRIKLLRALRSQREELRNPLGGYPSDAEGSAKVALLGMDRSLDAWVALRRHFPERDDDILDILILLDRLRKLTEKQFPEARAFVRPGLDETL